MTYTHWEWRMHTSHVLVYGVLLLYYYYSTTVFLGFSYPQMYINFGGWVQECEKNGWLALSYDTI